jgi:hypothetical protein
MTGRGNVSDDYEQKMRDIADELLSQIAADEISAEDAQRVLDISNAQMELIKIACETGSWSCSPEEKMRREATLIAQWPEACRRAGVGVLPMPDHFMRAIASFVGRAN